MNKRERDKAARHLHRMFDSFDSAGCSNASELLYRFGLELATQYQPDQYSLLEAAEYLGVSRERVRQMCANGSLPARQVGVSWVIDAPDLEEFAKHERKVGRPRTAATVN